MYTSTERIFDKLQGFAAGPENDLLGADQRKKPEKPSRTAQKQRILGMFGPIVTLWQQLG
jgi:hypothetical protein